MPAAARQNDTVVAQDTHIVLVPGSGPTPQPLPFNGRLMRDLSASVTIDGVPAAMAGSLAVNQPPHVPIGGSFQKPPSNEGRVQTGSTTVLIEGKAAARLGDPVVTCNDPVDLPAGQVTTGSPDVEVGP